MSRPGASARGYDREWERVRSRQLHREPLCRYCAEQGIVEPATEVDHVIPVRVRPDLRLDESNLQSLCETCHRAVKQSEERTGHRRGCTVEGIPLDPKHHWNRD